MAKEKISIISKEIFEASLLLYLVLIIFETVRTGFVSNFININYILGLVFISGIVMVSLEPKEMIQKPARYLYNKTTAVTRKARHRLVDGIR